MKKRTLLALSLLLAALLVGGFLWWGHDSTFLDLVPEARSASGCQILDPSGGSSVTLEGEELRALPALLEAHPFSHAWGTPGQIEGNTFYHITFFDPTGRLHTNSVLSDLGFLYPTQRWAPWTLYKTADPAVTDYLAALFEETAPAYTSPDGKYTASVSRPHWELEHPFTVTVREVEGGHTAEFPLSPAARSVENLSIEGSRLTVVSHSNPSLQVYQRFDLDSGTLLAEHYGYGFAETSTGLLFVQAQPHFSGDRGSCRIVGADGQVYYTSPQDAMILEGLEVSEGALVFRERHLSTGRETTRQIPLPATDQ